MEYTESKNEYKISPFLLACNALLVFLVIGMIFVLYNDTHKPEKAAAVVAPSENIHAFDTLSVLAKAAYVYDMSTGKVLFQKNPHAQLPLASLTKLMMAVTADDLLPANSHITIRKEFLASEGDNGLFANESWTLKNLLDFSLTVSSNDGARSIASVVGAYSLHTQDFTLGRKEFISQMNVRAKELGLSQTYFVNESGLDESATQSGGYGSAEDVAKLLEYIVNKKPQLLEATHFPKEQINSLTKSHTAKNTNEVTDKIPGLLASKTGYTALAGGNLGIVFDAGLDHPVVVVVLGSTQNGRFEDVVNLVNASKRYISN